MAVAHEYGLLDLAVMALFICAIPFLILLVIGSLFIPKQRISQ